MNPIRLRSVWKAEVLLPSFIVLRIGEVGRVALNRPTVAMDVSPRREACVASAPTERIGAARDSNREPSTQSIQRNSAGIDFFYAHVHVQTRQIAFGGNALAQGIDGLVPVGGAYGGRGCGDERGSTRNPISLVTCAKTEPLVRAAMSASTPLV